MAKKTILCLDDEKMILDSLKSQFKSLFGSKYAYEFAESGEEGLEILEELAEDGADMLLIVSDWLMPGMKGDEFLVQAHKSYPGIIKVLLTGQADEDAVERARNEANLHACLHKPWTEDDLLTIVKSALGE